MQPTLVITAAQPGLVYINGHFAGETAAGEALIRPTASHGALLLDYHPLAEDYRPMARRLVFSGGVPLAESVESAAGVSCVVWPGGIIEIELVPGEYLPRRLSFSRGGFHFLLEGGAEPRLQCEGRHFCTLPEGAELPELQHLRECVVLTGACREGKYLVTADAAMQAVTGFLRAKEIDVAADGRICCRIAPGDSVGHAAREEWQLTPAGLKPVSAVPSWEPGAPRWPQTPEDTAIAAVEAAMAGLDDEAEAYLAPRLREQLPLAGIGERCDLCVRMKYGLPGGESCVGLLRLEGGSLGRVRPLRYHAVASGSAQHPFLLDALEFE